MVLERHAGYRMLVADPSFPFATTVAMPDARRVSMSGFRPIGASKPSHAKEKKLLGRPMLMLTAAIVRLFARVITWSSAFLRSDKNGVAGDGGNIRIGIMSLAGAIPENVTPAPAAMPATWVP